MCLDSSTLRSEQDSYLSLGMLVTGRELEGNTSTVKKTMCPQFDTALEIRTAVG